MGAPDVLLSPGIYTYALRYVASDAVVSEGTTASLPWAVIDPAWKFPIRRATVSATLPAGTAIVGLKATIGASTGDDAGTWTSQSPTSASFIARRIVGNTEGLTINVDFVPEHGKEK